MGPGSQVLAARPVLLVDLPSCEAVADSFVHCLGTHPGLLRKLSFRVRRWAQSGCSGNPCRNELILYQAMGTFPGIQARGCHAFRFALGSCSVVKVLWCPWHPAATTSTVSFLVQPMLLVRVGKKDHFGVCDGPGSSLISVTVMKHPG